MKDSMKNFFKDFDFSSILLILGIIVVCILAAAAFNLASIKGESFYTVIGIIALVWMLLIVIKHIRNKKEVSNLNAQLLSVAQKSSEEHLSMQKSYSAQIAKLQAERNELLAKLNNAQVEKKATKSAKK